MRSTLEQEQRAHVPRARAEALWRLIEQHRDELAGPCMDPTIMDGATSGFQVTANGVDASFTCTNASTPAFDALSEAWRSLVQDVLPAPNP